MVSRDLKAITEKRKRHGKGIGVYSEWGREQAEREKRYEEASKRHKEASENARTERETAIRSTGLKIGDKVTDGRNTGRIVSFDPKTKSAIVNTGRRNIAISPTVLKII